jgi:hypothetical protein
MPRSYNHGQLILWRRRPACVKTPLQKNAWCFSQAGRLRHNG